MQPKEFIISLNEVSFYAHHGVLPQENVVGNEFIVSIDVRIPFDSNILDDCLDATISYADLYAIIETEMKRPAKLLETVAARTANEICLKWPQITGGHITICKSTPPINSITGQAKVTLIF